MFLNHQKKSPHCWKITQNVALEFGDFPPILVIFNKLLYTQNVNVARFARNVECDFLDDFLSIWPISIN